MKHYILDKRLVHAGVIALIAMAGLVVFIGLNNVSTTNANRTLESDLGIQKAKAKYWERRYDDLRESGTCLERTSEYEGVAG
ncbi:MAG: hypothetical protein PHV10_07845 [Sulfuricurvum sp.]|nr:hypothetical protein [Sulfuricurvum sp.]